MEKWLILDLGKGNVDEHLVFQKLSKHTQKMVGTRQKDEGTSLKGLPLAKFGII